MMFNNDTVRAMRDSRTKSEFIELLDSLIEELTDQTKDQADRETSTMTNTANQALTRVYLRASTDSQDAARAKDEVAAFAKANSLLVASYYQENISGTTTERPELDRLISDANQGDILLVEKVDRLARLPHELWKTLRQRIEDKGLIIMVVDQPMTHQTAVTDMQKVLTSFMLDLAASMAYDDYVTRRNRQAQGIKAAQAKGKYTGKKANYARYERILELIDEGLSWAKTAKELSCGKAAIQAAIKWRDAGKPQA